MALVTFQRDALGGPQDTTLHTTHLRIRGPSGPAQHAAELIDHPIPMTPSPLLFCSYTGPFYEVVEVGFEVDGF